MPAHFATLPEEELAFAIFRGRIDPTDIWVQVQHLKLSPMELLCAHGAAFLWTLCVLNSGPVVLW